MTPPIFNGLPGESVQEFMDRRNAEFAAAVGHNYSAPRFLSVQDVANRSSDGRF